MVQLSLKKLYNALSKVVMLFLAILMQSLLWAVGWTGLLVYVIVFHAVLFSQEMSAIVVTKESLNLK